MVAVAASASRNTRLVVATTAATPDPLGAVHLVKATLDGRGGGTARLAQGGASGRTAEEILTALTRSTGDVINHRSSRQPHLVARYWQQQNYGSITGRIP
ncbi:hypothetical protein ACIA5A_19080 [Micromonospora sp. NPDC051300]|uniref:hypothetical protein n=1 Tax=Micromonospora sp. NPDC051300 TaxID=3364286 RepID=UPI0037A49FC9